MKKMLIAATIALSTNIAIAGEFTGNVNGFVGNKDLDKDDWAGYEDQAETGIIFDFKMKDWPFSIAVDLFISADDEDNVTNDSNDDIEVDAVTTELHLGLRKIWNINGTTFNPYIGGGLAYVSGYLEREVNGEKTDRDDTGVGGWVGVGIYWRPITHLNVGLDIRYSQAEVSLFGEDLETGGLHSGITVGYHW